MAFSKVTKNDLVDAIYQSTNYERQEILEITDLLIQNIKSSLEKGSTIELRRFGTFEARLRKGRPDAKNPKTGERVKVEPHYVVAFRSGKELKDNLWKLKPEED